LLNQIYRALADAYRDTTGEPARTGADRPDDDAFPGGNRPTREASEYSILAGFGVLLLLASFAIAGVHRHTDPAPAGPSSSIDSQAQPTTAPPARTATCHHIDIGHRPTLAPGPVTGDTDDTRQAVLQVQCLIKHNSGYPAEIVPDGVFGPQTQHGVLWIQNTTGSIRTPPSATQRGSGSTLPTRAAATDRTRGHCEPPPHLVGSSRRIPARVPASRS
jgi:hypothetical protein